MCRYDVVGSNLVASSSSDSMVEGRMLCSATASEEGLTACSATFLLSLAICWCVQKQHLHFPRRRHCLHHSSFQPVDGVLGRRQRQYLVHEWNKVREHFSRPSRCGVTIRGVLLLLETLALVSARVGRVLTPCRLRCVCRRAYVVITTKSVDGTLGPLVKSLSDRGW